MGSMFQNAIVYNQDISGWNVSAVSDHTDFATGATAFESQNQPIW